MKTWQGQLRTLKDRLEHGIGDKVPKDLPVLQWLAWWSASVLHRVAVKSHGRTVLEHTVGHRMKTPLCAFWKAVLFRSERHIGALNQYDSEWTDGIFLGRILIGCQCIGWYFEGYR